MHVSERCLLTMERRIPGSYSVVIETNQLPQKAAPSGRSSIQSVLFRVGSTVEGVQSRKEKKAWGVTGH